MNDGARTVVTSDGIALEAELATPSDGPPRAGMVLCHPHPQYGGTMRSIVISALFDALPRIGVTCLRFNFRGVENSEGEHDEGRGERLDAIGAIEVLDEELASTVPLVLTGWSFGGDIALGTVHDRIAAWFAIAPPLRFHHDVEAVAHDPRLKVLALAEHDEFRSPASIVETAATWVNTETEIVGGASHFFVGRTDRLVTVATALVNRVAG
jgi:alpha/beta superfamily hydrolase